MRARAIPGSSHPFSGVLHLGLLFGAAILASEVSEGETRAFDRTILLALRATGNPSDPIGPAWLETVMRDITSLGSTTIISLITMLVLIYFALVRRFLAGALVLAAIVGGTVVSSALKVIVGRPRPTSLAISSMCRQCPFQADTPCSPPSPT